MNLRKRIEKEATIEVIAEQDYIPVRGNASASGDDKYDKRVEDRIIRRLDEGDIWAWASVTVRGTWRGLTAEDHLGACNYRDEKDFRRDGYFDDMRDNVLSSLVEQAQELVAAVGASDPDA